MENANSEKPLAALSTAPRVRRPAAVRKRPPIGKLSAAREAVRDFLVNEFAAHEVQITKIGPSADVPHGWYAEAEIMITDLGIKTLGLPLSQDVYEREHCAIDLDGEMTVTSCEVIEPRGR